MSGHRVALLVVYVMYVCKNNRNTKITMEGIHVDINDLDGKLNETRLYNWNHAAMEAAMFVIVSQLLRRRTVKKFFFFYSFFKLFFLVVYCL